MKIATIVGARPQFIKCGPVSRHLRTRADEFLIHTGQHYDSDMSQVFFDDLGIPPPDINLHVGSGTHGRQTAEMLERIEDVLIDCKPDRVIVYGDTNSTLAGALAAAKLHIPIAHIEAGLRSYNRRMPEEVNRVITDHLSDLLFCPTPDSVANLNNEGIRAGVTCVGDVMRDALLHNIAIAETRSTILSDPRFSSQKYCLVTVHRAENTDDPEILGRIFAALITLAEQGQTIIFPVHPRTREQLRELKIPMNDKLCLLPPVSYLDMMVLEKNAQLVLTDSGGVQKEACWLSVPCVTLREETEWTDTVESGWNRLAGTQPFRILNGVQQALNADRRRPLDAYTAGTATAAIVDAIMSA